MEKAQIKDLYTSPIMDLIDQAREVHKKNFKKNETQTSQLLSIKTGACPEDCAYCSQSARWNTGLKKEKLLSLDIVKQKAKKAKEEGATRFCMGAAWREIREGSSFNQVLEMVKEVRSLDMEVCCSLGMLNLDQAKKLKEAGLYAYNHNIDTSRNFYKNIITTRKYEDRLKTLENVRKAGITVCTGGILGMGETNEDRIDFIHELNLLNPAPESITINCLVPIKGTPLEKATPIAPLDLVRVIAVCRITRPKSMIRLSAGRKNLSETEQLLCFYAGANSIFIGQKLLTTKNATLNKDKEMLKRLGMKIQKLPNQSLSGKIKIKSPSLV